MKQKLISETAYEPVVLPKDISGLGEFLAEYRPQYINHGSNRNNGSIPLVKPDPDNVLRWNGCVGVFHVLYPPEAPEYDVTIRIRSRFDTEDRHYFLAALLHSWVENSSNSVHMDDVFVDGSWREIFDFMRVAVFRQQLMDAYETGIYRGYQYCESNSDRLRGSIDIPRHIRLNMGMNNGKIAMRYRENTPDNAMNHLILYTYNELKQRYPMLVSMLIDGDACRTILENLQYLAPSYSKTDSVSVAAKLSKPISNPLYDAYECLRDTCLQILDEQNFPVFEKGKGQQKTMLFYIPDLWENFIERQILSRLNGVTVKTQLKVSTFHGQMNFYPDFVLFKENKRIVLDAKYKEKWGNFPKTNHLEDDIKQVLVYYAILHAAYAGIIFPTREHKKGSECSETFSEYDPQKDGSFRIFDVRIPQFGEESYQQWREAMTAEEKYTARRIDALCKEMGISSQEGKQ